MTLNSQSKGRGKIILSLLELNPAVPKRVMDTSKLRTLQILEEKVFARLNALLKNLTLKLQRSTFLPGAITGTLGSSSGRPPKSSPKSKNIFPTFTKV